MFITPRSYSDSQTPDQSFPRPSSLRFHSITGWQPDPARNRRAAEMILLHQAGSVRVGEAVRYTLTYTPSADSINPIPAELHVRVKNTSAIPLRAAYLHGPYTLYTSCYPSTFDPHIPLEEQDNEGIPQFEPYLKAGGSWKAVIPIPKHLRPKPNEPTTSRNRQSVTWVIEIISQVIFSTTAVVNFELLVGRNEGSVELSPAGGGSISRFQQAAQLRDHMASATKGKQIRATKGVFSEAISLRIDDTASLWNKPPFPSEDGSAGEPQLESADDVASTQQDRQSRKKVHLVILTHGLHSNLGADMLYLKESIDAATKKTQEGQSRKPRQASASSYCPTGSNERRYSDDGCVDNGDSDDELVIVRGFSGNAVRTERGIQYLGKRLAKYVLFMTYPDQPYIPRKKTRSRTFSGSMNAWKSTKETNLNDAFDPHIHADEGSCEHRSYQITSISFIGHSLGGLIQTYAIAYIQKHSPAFFDLIRPVNFIALATPFLGLSNENPMYVRFALDLGLVGRTGQDLGLSWTAPRVRSGWEAMIGGKGTSVRPHERPDDGPKPLLRVLPCGPAHEALSKFDRRTVYSNVVNDGIVPLRTSCLLFLDWRGLERVEKARRQNGLVSTMAEWGWAELTGANSISPQSARSPSDIKGSSIVGSPVSSTSESSSHHPRVELCGSAEDLRQKKCSVQPPSSPLSSFFSIFRSKGATSKSNIPSGYKHTKIYKRSQTLSTSSSSGLAQTSSSKPPHHQEHLTRSSSYDEFVPHAPPKTTFFESAGDLLMPPIPPIEFIVDPASRPRTIFHDRIYYPEDIPPPLPTKRKTLPLSTSESKTSGVQGAPAGSIQNPLPTNIPGTSSGLRAEEKIARAYHREMTWRKVLVRLEPDAHNNIIVRRMFTNAYGWPVVKHLVDSHFGQNLLAQCQEGLGNGTQKANPPVFATCDSEYGVEVQGNPLGRELQPPTCNMAPVNLPATPNHTVFQSERRHYATNPDPTEGEYHEVLRTTDRAFTVPMS